MTTEARLEDLSLVKRPAPPWVSRHPNCEKAAPLTRVKANGDHAELGPVIIQLGRYGDILNILPLCKWFSDHGKRPTLVVATEFADILQSITYCGSATLDISYGEVAEAEGWARRQFPNREIIVTQVVMGTSYKMILEKRGANFCASSYYRVSEQCHADFFRGDFNQIMIDRRYPEDEENLWLGSVEKYGVPLSKPVILYNLKAKSNPAPRDVAVLEGLFEGYFGVAYEIVNLQQVNAKRFTDLLGLYDRAACLVTVDTATLHLAGAHTIPYVALVADTPTPWFASHTRGNCIKRIPYSDFDIHPAVTKLAQFTVIETIKEILK